MEKNFNYKNAPQGYLHCLNESCEKSSECLRYQVGKYIDNDTPYHRLINNAYVIKHKKCDYFQVDELLRHAYGITHLYDNLPHNKYQKIKKAVHEYFGHAYYYLIYNKLRPVKPKDQDFIREQFLKAGIKEEPLFDEYREEYDFIPLDKHSVL